MPNRKIPRALFEPIEEMRADELEDNEALINLVKKETPAAIEEAFKANKTFATLFEVNATGMYIDLPKTQWIPALEQCIAYKLQDEKFEDCIELKELIDQIRKGSKTLANKSLKQTKNGKGTIGNTDSDQ